MKVRMRSEMESESEDEMEEVEETAIKILRITEISGKIEINTESESKVNEKEKREIKQLVQKKEIFPIFRTFLQRPLQKQNKA